MNFGFYTRSKINVENRFLKNLHIFCACGIANFAGFWNNYRVVFLISATSRVNPSGGTGPEMDSATAAATLGRRPLGGNNAHRSSLANQSRISAASHHNQTNPMLLNGGGLRQQSANMEDYPVAPEELMLQFATQNGIGTMYIPGSK